MRTIGTKVMGVRTPIIMEGDDVASIVADSLLEAAREEGFSLNDHDVVGVTEAVVARGQGNYATIDHIAQCVRGIFKSGAVGVVFPIMSRNRFAVLLRGIAMGADRVIVQLSYPSDEVGNELISKGDMFDKGLNPYTDTLSEARYRELFGHETRHRYTGVDYVQYYKGLGSNIEIILSSNPAEILTYTDQVIAADIHSREFTKRSLKKAGARLVIGLDNILSAPVNNSGYNEQYGLLGSNKASETRVKLFPRDTKNFALDVQKKILAATGKHIEVLVYGDGGFKDPVDGIWELADPVVCPGFTEGLTGTPNELKLKYLADNKFSHLSGEALKTALKDEIRQKDKTSLMGKMDAEGTTPRQLSDLLGSLCDLTSGSGDKGTPVVLIQGYFDNYSD